MKSNDKTIDGSNALDILSDISKFSNATGITNEGAHALGSQEGMAAINRLRDSHGVSDKNYLYSKIKRIDKLKKDGARELCKINKAIKFEWNISAKIHNLAEIKSGIDEEFFPRHINMNIIDKWMMGGGYSIDFARTITDDASKWISEYEGSTDYVDFFMFENLETLSEESARYLSNSHHKLRLSPVAKSIIRKISKKVISQEIANIFTSNKNSVKIDEFNDLTRDAAMVLSKFRGEVLDLSGLTEVDVDTLRELCRFSGKLVLSGIYELDESTARALSEHKGWLFLRGLTNLSPEAANGFCSHEGCLTLRISELSDDAALILSKHRGSLYLERLELISSKGLEALAKKHGTINKMDPAEWAASCERIES
jgi:hypothetical protein